MYTYHIEKIDNSNSKEFQLNFDTYFQEKSKQIEDFLKENCVYNICAKFNNQIVGSMGVMKYDIIPELPEIKEDHWQFFHLLVHPDHRNQGIALGIIRMAVKFLINLGAKKIRNHKRENIIPHTVFTDMGFELINFDDEKLDYKWTYELDVSKADINKLKEIWSHYSV